MDLSLDKRTVGLSAELLRFIMNRLSFSFGVCVGMVRFSHKICAQVHLHKTNLMCFEGIYLMGGALICLV